MKGLIYAITIIMLTFNNSDLNLIPTKMEKYSVQQEQVESSTIFMLKNGIQFYYKSEDGQAVEIVNQLLEKLPSEFLIGVQRIDFEGKNGNVAGRTRGKDIILFDFMNYEIEAQKRILYHEIAHTYSNVLSAYGFIESDYADYAVFVKKDKNYVTDYAKSYIKEQNSYSEDFADSVALYFSNPQKLKKKHSNRYQYIDKLINEENLTKLIESMEKGGFEYVKE